MKQYVIRGGAEGKARLSILSQALGSSTLSLLKRVGVQGGSRCVDLGCGGGDVTLEMARLVGERGHVVGIDMDSEKLRLARIDAARENLDNVEYREQDVGDFAEKEAYDCVYARFLLTHLPDPGELLRRMAQAVHPGGTVAIEDIDFTGIVSYPPCAAVERHIELYRELVRRRGGDADIGPKLPDLMHAAGISRVQVQIVQPVFLEGRPKFIHSITTSSIAGPLVSEGLISSEELDTLVTELDEFAGNSRTLSSMPRIFQTWGYPDLEHGSMS